MSWFLTLRPVSPALSKEYVAAIIWWVGFLPMYQAGKNSEANMLLPWRGGKNIINLGHLPLSTASKYFAINLWWLAIR
jgi:hypothetical protein